MEQAVGGALEPEASSKERVPKAETLTAVEANILAVLSRTSSINPFKALADL